MKKIPLTWTVGHHPTADQAPEAWIPAAVPGAVQLDWARAHNWPEYWMADNCKQYPWMENEFWTYRATLDFPGLREDEELYFVCGGVDYQFEVWLDHKCLHQQEGMFTPVRLKLTAHAMPGDELRVVVHPTPKQAREASGVFRMTNCRPAVGRGGDFHPPLNPLGIWRETFLEIRPRQHIRESEVLYELSGDLRTARIRQAFTLNESSPAHLVWQIRDPAGEVVSIMRMETADPEHVLEMDLNDPQLWWTHDRGRPALYTSELELRTPSGELLDSKSTRIGFRRVRLVMHEGAWDMPDPYPRSRNPPPITLELNGCRLFSRGTNLVGPSIFPGTVTRETYAPLVAAMKETNFNLVRLWGGAIVPPDEFYDLCDETGILVWQEFPLACAYYPDDPHFLRVLDQESQSIIKRLRSRASLAFWCGGNELFNPWSMDDDQSHALRLLNRNCFDLDRGRAYLPTSPLMGMAHGNYVFYNWELGVEAFGLFIGGDKTAYTEFGVGGATSAEHIRSFIPEAEWFPPARGTSWETHRALGAWEGDRDSWLCPRTLERYFGPSATLEELCARSQRLQAIGFQMQYEEARKQKPRCSMALNWCFNEPWPNAANNSLIAWPFHPKPALAGVRAACRPVLASARIGKFMWEPGEIFTAELWLLSDSPDGVEPLAVEAAIEWAGKVEEVLTWQAGALAPNKNLQGPRLECRLPFGVEKNFTLHLRVRSRPELDSSYPLVLSPTTR